MGAGGDLRDLSLDLRDFERSSFPGFATEKLDFGHHGFGEVGAFLRRKKTAQTSTETQTRKRCWVWGVFGASSQLGWGFVEGVSSFGSFFVFCFLYATHFVSNLSWWNKKSTTSSERLQALLWKFPTGIFSNLTVLGV